MPTAKNPYAKAIRITWVVVGIGALAFVVGLPFRSTGAIWAIIPMAGGLTIAAIGALSVPLLAAYGRSAQRQVQHLLDGDHLAHWVYGQAEWDKFTQAEWAAAGGRAARLGLQAAGWMLAVGVALHFLADDVSITEGVLFGAGAGLGMGVIVGGLSYIFALAEHRSRRATPGEVYVGAGGVLVNGAYTSWNMGGMTLEEVKIEPGDPQVLLFAVASSRGASAKVRVPVPAGKESAAAKVVHGLGGEKPHRS